MFVIVLLLRPGISFLFRMSNRALSRTVVFLDKRLNSVPSNVYYERLLRGGRVMDIAFTRNSTPDEIWGKFMDCFPTLAASDLDR